MMIFWLRDDLGFSAKIVIIVEIYVFTDLMMNTEN